MRQLFRRRAGQFVASAMLFWYGRPMESFGAEESPTASKAAAAIRVMHDEVAKLRLSVERGKEKKTAELKPEPILRYTDPQREFPDATLWVWTVDGRPAGFSKLEQCTNAGKPYWQYCLSSTNDDHLAVRWTNGDVWKSQRASLIFRSLEGQDPPQETASRRLIQMRNIAKQFRATIVDLAGGAEEMRLLTQPLMRYSSPDKSLIDGAVFGVASNGTNPDALLLVQVRQQATEPRQVWEYGWLGITGDAVTVHLDKTPVFKHSGANAPGDHGSWVWRVIPIE